jgi:hypothetical protein
MATPKSSSAVVVVEAVALVRPLAGEAGEAQVRLSSAPGRSPHPAISMMLTASCPLSRSR